MVEFDCLDIPFGLELKLHERPFWTVGDHVRGKLTLSCTKDIRLSELALFLECRVNITADQQRKLLKLRKKKFRERGVIFSRRLILFPTPEVSNKEHKLVRGKHCFSISIELSDIGGYPPSVGNSECGVVWELRVRRKCHKNHHPLTVLERPLKIYPPLKRVDSMFSDSTIRLHDTFAPVIDTAKARQIRMTTEKEFDIKGSLSRTHSMLYDTPIVSKVKVTMNASFTDILTKPPRIELYFSEPGLVQVTIAKICLETIGTLQSRHGTVLHNLPNQPLVSFDPISVDETIELLPQGYLKKVTPTFAGQGLKIQHYLVVECWGFVKGSKKHHRFGIRYPVVVG